MSTYESQKTYELKFTIKQTYSDTGSEDMDPREDLDTVMGPDSATRGDLVKAFVEKKIQEAIPMIQGAVTVEFDSLTES